MHAMPPSRPLLLVAMGILLAGCAAHQEDWPASKEFGASVVVLERDDERADNILREAFPKARRLHPSQLVTAGPALRQDGQVLVIAHPRDLPAATWAAVTNHIARGGRTLFWGQDPGSGPGNAELPMLRPPSEYFSFDARELRGLDQGLLQQRNPIRLQSPFPRPTGMGTPEPAAQRWIPLAAAGEIGEPPRGWPASLLIEAPRNASARIWGWIGWDPDPRFARIQRALLREAAGRLAQRHLLLKGGLDRASLDPGEPFNIRIDVAAAPADAGPWRVTAELENADGVVTRRAAETLSAGAPVSLVSTSLFLGTAPKRNPRAEWLRLRVMLNVPGETEPIDSITQLVNVRADTPAVRTETEERIGVRGANFIIGRRPVALIGAAYTPLAAPGPRNALDAEGFSPDQMDVEVNRLREAGFNIVSIRCTDPAQAPQARLLLDKLRDRQLWALVELPSLSPWAPDWTRAQAILSELRLATGHRVFAISTGPIAPPRPGQEADAALRAWRDWITEQYGSAAHATRALGVDPTFVAPSDWWIHDEQQPDALREAIRRFLADFAGRQYGACRALLASAGWNGLFTASSGFTLEPHAGAHQLDFLTLDGSLLETAEAGRAEFFTAYARAVSGGKPVLWQLRGPTVTYPPTAEQLRNQADAMEFSLRGMIRAHAGGVLAAGLIGGPTGPDAADVGLMNPSGAWRSAGDRFRTYAQDWRRSLGPPPPWRGREVDVGDIRAAWASWRGRQSAELNFGEMEELRPAGWARRSDEAAPLGLGGALHMDPAPFLDLNAEWTTETPDITTPRQTRVRQPLRMELINTGLATWAPSITSRVGSVWVRAMGPGNRDVLLPVRETPPGARATITWTPADAGAWLLRPYCHPAGLFGQPLQFRVE